MDLRLLSVMFLLSQAFPRSTQEDGSQSVADCPESFQCGNLTLMFPFTQFLNHNCGLCMVDCSNQSSPKIALGNPPQQWFEAKSINNTAMTVTLHSGYVQSLLLNRDCFAFYYEITLPNSPSISFTLLNNITLYTCHRDPKTNQKINGTFRGYGYYGGCRDDFIFYNKSQNSVPRFGHLCSAIYLPRNKTNSPDNNSDVLEIFQFLGADLDIQWHVSLDCYDCHHRGGVCQTEWSRGPRCLYAENKNSLGTGKKKVLIGFAAAGGGMVLLACFLLCFYKIRRSSDASMLVLRMKTRKDPNLEAFVRQYGTLAPKWYLYSDIKKMTNSFKDELGKGGYGTVYKGELPDGRFVAVKILNVANENDEDFINEMLSISKTSHVNVVKLLGFCVQEKRGALVYEYMPNGSLEKYIHASKNCEVYCQLGMDKLYQISLGVARGLEYLHRGCNTRILHFDIKPHNILLDKDFCPKISDFGMAKQCTNKESVVSILGARGTIGYIAPELTNRCFGVVSYKSDVYSYGMMILEIVGRRKNVNVETSNASEIFSTLGISACGGGQRFENEGGFDP